VLAGSVRHQGSTLLFRVRDPKQKLSVPVRYTGIVPDPFAEGRGVLVTVKEQGSTSTSTFVGEQNSLTTKCPSKYQAASSSY
jgi:cytochrome c-type biogenesis protein CcmE